MKLSALLAPARRGRRSEGTPRRARHLPFGPLIRTADPLSSSAAVISGDGAASACPCAADVSVGALGKLRQHHWRSPPGPILLRCWARRTVPCEIRPVTAMFRAASCISWPGGLERTAHTWGFHLGKIGDGHGAKRDGARPARQCIQTNRQDPAVDIHPGHIDRRPCNVPRTSSFVSWPSSVGAGTSPLVQQSAPGGDRAVVLAEPVRRAASSAAPALPATSMPCGGGQRRDLRHCEVRLDLLLARRDRGAVDGEQRVVQSKGRLRSAVSNPQAAVTSQRRRGQRVRLRPRAGGCPFTVPLSVTSPALP